MRFIEQFDRLLKDDIVRKEVTQLVGELSIAYMLDGTTNYDLGSDFLVGDARDMLTTCARGMDDIFIRRLPQPAPVLAEELVVPFMFACANEDEDDGWYDRDMHRFLEQLGPLRIVSRRSPPLQVGSGPFFAVRDGELVHGTEPITLFESDTGFSIRLLGVLPAAADGRMAYRDWFHTACVQLEGEFSQLALDAAAGELRAVFSTLIRSGVVLLQTAVAYEFVDMTDATRADEEPAETEDFTLHGESSDDGDSAESEDYEDATVEQTKVHLVRHGPLIDNGKLGPWFEFIRPCLGAYYAKPTKKDSISRRLTTAMRLLTQADMQPGNGVGLSLAVAATEAMLCRKGGDLASMFGLNAATLLEPEPRNRKPAVEWCKKLYGLRSDVLHGSAFDASRQELVNARLLAAAVLKGMVERREHLRLAGHEPETPDDLFKELADHWAPHPNIVGVKESPVAYLWRQNQQT